MGRQGGDRLMPIVTQQDMIDRVGEARLAEVTNRDGPVGGIDTGVLQTALDDAVSEIESYVGGRYDRADPPRVLTVHATAIAWYRLLGDRAPAVEGARDAFDAAIAFLRRVRAGDAALGDETPAETPATGAGMPAHGGPGPVFDRDSLKGF